jgi:hypothetical protein
MKMEQIECSETSAYKIQTLRNHPEENIQYTEHGESLKSRKSWIVDIEEDMQIMGIRVWRTQCDERAEWKRISEKGNAHCGLQCQ